MKRAMCLKINRQLASTNPRKKKQKQKQNKQTNKNRLGNTRSKGEILTDPRIDGRCLVSQDQKENKFKLVKLTGYVYFQK